jgi:WD40 repeat protein
MSPDGKQVATASRDRTARVLDVKTGVIEGTFTGHEVPVLSVAFSPGGQELISGGTDGEVRRWKLNGEGIKDTTIRPGGRTEVLGLTFLKADTPLAVLANGLAMTMEPKSRKGKDKLTRHEDRVNALCLSGSGDAQRLITASHDGQVRVIEVKTAKEMLKWIASPGW